LWGTFALMVGGESSTVCGGRREALRALGFQPWLMYQRVANTTARTMVAVSKTVTMFGRWCR